MEAVPDQHEVCSANRVHERPQNVHFRTRSSGHACSSSTSLTALATLHTHCALVLCVPLSRLPFCALESQICRVNRRVDVADDRQVSDDSGRRECVKCAAIGQRHWHMNPHHCLSLFCTCLRCCTIVSLTRLRFPLAEQITLNERDSCKTLTGRARPTRC